MGYLYDITTFYFFDMPFENDVEICVIEHCTAVPLYLAKVSQSVSCLLLNQCMSNAHVTAVADKYMANTQ